MRGHGSPCGPTGCPSGTTTPSWGSSSTGASIRCPGWAPRVPDIQQLLIHDGPKRMLRESPYAEWYRNSMQIKGSPTQEYHARTYGEDYPYDNFVRTFDDASVRRRARCDRRPLPGGGGPLRRAHHQAPRRLRALALPCPAPGQGRVPRPPRPGGRSERGGSGPAHAHGALLLGRLRLALQRRRAVDRRRCGAGRAPGSPLRGVRHGALPRAHRTLPAVRPLERHRLAQGPPAARALRATTTTPWRRASSTTAGGSPAWPAMR